MSPDGGTGWLCRDAGERGEAPLPCPFSAVALGSAPTRRGAPDPPWPCWVRRVVGARAAGLFPAASLICCCCLRRLALVRPHTRSLASLNL